MFWLEAKLVVCCGQKWGNACQDVSFRIFEQLALALKTEFALKFSRQGGGRPPDSPPRTSMLMTIEHKPS